MHISEILSAGIVIKLIFGRLIDIFTFASMCIYMHMTYATLPVIIHQSFIELPLTIVSHETTGSEIENKNIFLYI